MSFEPALPHIKITTRFHRKTEIPRIAELNDFEEQFLFCGESSEEHKEFQHSFWLIHEFDECLWILSASPGIEDEESVLTWCHAPSVTDKTALLRKMLTEWCLACERNNRPTLLLNQTTTGNIDLAEAIKQTKRMSFTPLHDAAYCNDDELIARLLSEGYSTDMRDADGRTPLHLAVFQGNRESVQQLLSLGADPIAEDNDGSIAMDLTESRTNDEMKQLFESEICVRSSTEFRMGFPASVNIRSVERSPVEDLQNWLLRARYWADQKEYRVAWYLYDSIACREDIPQIVSSRAMRGAIRSLFQLGFASDMDAGLVDLSKETRYPVNARAGLLLKTAKLCIRHGDIKAAENWLETLFSLDGVSGELQCHATIQLAKCQDKNGDTIAAIQKLDAVLVMNGLAEDLRASAFLLRGKLLYDEGLTQKAISDLTQSINQSLSLPSLRVKSFVARSKCYEELGQPQKVIEDLADAVKLDIGLESDAAAALHNYGVRCNLRGNPGKAFEYFNAVTDFNCRSSFITTNAIVNRGCFLGDQGKYDAAIVEFKQALSSHPIPDEVLARATYNLGNARRCQENHKAAIRHFSTLFDMENVPEPTLAAAYCRSGICWGKLDKTVKGLRLLGKAIEFEDADLDTIENSLLWAGIFSHRLEDLESAEQSFRRLIDHPNASREMRARAKWGLGDIKCDKGELDAGCQLYSQARFEFIAIERMDLVEILDESIKDNGCKDTC